MEALCLNFVYIKFLNEKGLCSKYEDSQKKINWPLFGMLHLQY